MVQMCGVQHAILLGRPDWNGSKIFMGSCLHTGLTTPYIMSGVWGDMLLKFHGIWKPILFIFKVQNLSPGFLTLTWNLLAKRERLAQTALATLILLTGDQSYTKVAGKDVVENQVSLARTTGEGMMLSELLRFGRENYIPTFFFPDPKRPTPNARPGWRLWVQTGSEEL